MWLVVPAGLLYKLGSWRTRFQQMCWQENASRQENWVFFLPIFLWKSPAEGVTQIKVVHYHALVWNMVVLGWPWTQRSTCLSLPRLKACTTLPEPKIFMVFRPLLCQDPGYKPVSSNLKIWITGVISISGLRFIPHVVTLTTRNSCHSLYSSPAFIGHARSASFGSLISKV